ncbi:hypothetical protein T4B_3297 [Trichinella pseudospiralis]|uniref:Peptidase aspartic putative domain-containing protein n=1 Tax=Trichinella pseudospiralis TaxID=6337 RepID=A0A0V1H966_TRIPS|nr:hypothetical protein T4B_3297 [Trichinella pseudospiralis]
MGTVRSHAQQHDESAPRAAKEVLNNMYMDNLATSCNSVEEAQTLDLNKKWEESNASIPANLESFLEFVRKQIDIEAKVTFTKGTKSTGVKKAQQPPQKSISRNTRCLLCQKFHDISVCTQFLASDVEERWRVAKRLRLCHSSLKKGHRKIECSASRKTATGKTTIHDLLKRKGAGDKKIDEKTEENITKVCLKMSVDKRDRSSSYLNGSLQIARAVIWAENGIKRTANCILHSGAQRSFVRKEVVESLGLNGPKEHITISSFNQLNEHRKLMLVQIPNNYEQAERRLQQLEKKLINNDKRAKEYDEVIKNYIEGGWIGETDVRDGIPGKTWYLPHHAVYRDDKTTTRPRASLAEPDFGHFDLILMVQNKSSSRHFKDVSADTAGPRR